MIFNKIHFFKILGQILNFIFCILKKIMFLQTEGVFSTLLNSLNHMITRFRNTLFSICKRNFSLMF
ncbi:hypothetical protein LEP1GSC168_2326 [Leptospira santarosai str. HAI134]|uniref:Uncharacterized protein n=1 Tax=Leptospira santarosai serovar Arenal str. MAVJ 401 TaxID=1049976 RepID=M6JSS8_9LEPT|nr:hypothetical protein LEP1GSC063_1812 [Leptospira santarosai serovar Arenal str. MAVJ 401]EMO22322.1 hypothetical protein LEP1GSC168_2326 [Leptospira santarosai str. HAI134]